MMNRFVMSWSRPGWSALGLLVAYYAVPVTWGDSSVGLALSLVVTAAGLLLLASMMSLEFRTVRRGDKGRSDRVVAMMLLLLIAAFSMAFYLLELAAPDQMTGLKTRTDALYFTLSTMATVGYGDVHATGQLARAMVCAMIVFSVVVVASVVRIHRLGHRSP